jgi:hypothetical protein
MAGRQNGAQSPAGGHYTAFGGVLWAGLALGVNGWWPLFQHYLAGNVFIQGRGICKTGLSYAAGEAGPVRPAGQRWVIVGCLRAGTRRSGVLVNVVLAGRSGHRQRWHS